MTDKELRRLSRRELLDIIYQLKKKRKNSDWPFGTGGAKAAGA